MPEFRPKLPLELRSEVGTARRLPLLQTRSLGLNRKDSPATMFGQMTTYRYLRGKRITYWKGNAHSEQKR